MRDIDPDRVHSRSARNRALVTSPLLTPNAREKKRHLLSERALHGIAVGRGSAIAAFKNPAYALARRPRHETTGSYL